MKRAKIMLSTILVMAIVAGAFAFKAKKANGVCVYQTATIKNGEGQVVLACPKLGNYTEGAFPNITTLSQVWKANVPCENGVLPPFTLTSKCTTTIIDVTRE